MDRATKVGVRVDPEISVQKREIEPEEFIEIHVSSTTTCYDSIAHAVVFNPVLNAYGPLARSVCCI